MYATVEGSYVLVNEKPERLSVEDVRGRLATVDGLLRRHGLRTVIFDSRRTEGACKEARAIWWAWLERGECHDRVAVVADSEMVRVSGNLTALSKKVSFRSFETMDDAVAWVGCSSAG